MEYPFKKMDYIMVDTAVVIFLKEMTTQINTAFSFWGWEDIATPSVIACAIGLIEYN